MSSVKREPENGGRRPGRWLAAVATVVLASAACQRGGVSDAQVYTPPPPLALVALLDPASDRLPAELQQLQDVITADATPNEAVVVMFLEPSFGAIYVVQSGDSLSKIAGAHTLTLQALEAANPQLGPLSGRDWKLIHPGEHVILPDGAAQGALVLASKAPSGPPPPTLVRVPQPPSNPTDFQRAQYKRTFESDNLTNASRIAAWQSATGYAICVTGSAESKLTQREMDLAASVQAGLATLEGLGGRRVLLLLGGGDIGPAPLGPKSLADVNLVIANLTSSNASAAWTTAGSSAGAASVSALDAALTQLQLPHVVNRRT